ncbi:MAG: methylmalonyl Co-A mutase-associated GTPase MeaB [Haloferacaceae archaeon]
MTGEDPPKLVADLLDGDVHALARTISRIENRSGNYRDLVSALYPHTGSASVVGITGSPGAGKSTLVDELVAHYRDAGETVGVIAVDPSSPYTGGAVLGDRVRMGSAVGDAGVFVRSMSARGHLGGLSTATGDAAKALDAFGMDRILIETVGAGQNEVEVVRTADTAAVLVQPGSGDDVQMLKAGILEIGDVFVVNKADLDGAERTAADLEEMLELQGDAGRTRVGHHGAVAAGDASDGGAPASDGVSEADADPWDPPVLQTVATRGEGVAAFADALDDHRAHLDGTGELDARSKTRAAAEIRRLLRQDTADLVEAELRRQGGIEEVAARVAARDTDPYTVADDLLGPLRDCLADRRDR